MSIKVILNPKEPVPVTLPGQGPPGRSAYESAVAAGFEGSEQDWLDSLAAGGVTAVPILRRTLPASAALSGHRAVIERPDGTLRYPSLADPDDAALICGLSENAAAQGGAVSVTTSGPVDHAGWAWTPGPVFAGDDGVLSQSPPSGAWVRQIGVAISSSRVLVQPGLAILTP